MRRTILLGLTLGLLILFETTALRAPARLPEPAIAVKPVRYDDLMKQIRDLKGKVVVVDIWAEY